MGDPISIGCEDDVVVAAMHARILSDHSNNVDLVVRELAWNLVRHADGGHLEFRRDDGDGRGRLHIVSRDTGPGLTSMHSRSPAGGLGMGIGIVRRHADQFTLNTRAGGGTSIEVVVSWPCKST